MIGLIGTGIAIALLLWVAWDSLNVYMKAKVAQTLMADPKPYDALTTEYGKTLLILGDSTGVGTGASTPEDTVAARLAVHLGATYVENQSKNGAAVDDLTTQIQHLHLSHYDVILLQIGGNDILALHEPKKTAERLAAITKTLPDAEKIVLMTAGNVGGATLIPHLIRPFYTWLNLRYHKAFGRMAKEEGITYVNLYRKPSEDPFIQDPDRYLAEDGLHPSSEGYGLWFEHLKASM